MAKIAVDIDSTLYDFETPAREAFQRLADERGDKSLFRGLYVPWTEWRSPSDACGLEDWLTVIDMVHEPQSISSQVPFPGCASVLQGLEDAGHELFYVTSRKSECHEATSEWLDTYFPEGMLICSDEDKSQHLTHCQYIIDDRPKTLVQFVYGSDWDQQRVGFGLMYEYNRALTDIPNIYLAPSWEGLRYYLKREGLVPVANDIRIALVH